MRRKSERPQKRRKVVWSISNLIPSYMAIIYPLSEIEELQSKEKKIIQPPFYVFAVVPHQEIL